MTRLFIPVKAQQEIKDTNELDNLFVEPHFGRTRYYLLIDTKTNQKLMLKNIDKNSRGHNPVQLARNNNTEVVIAGQLGERPLISFTNANIPVYKANLNESISSLVENFENHKLK